MSAYASQQQAEDDAALLLALVVDLLPDDSAKFAELVLMGSLREHWVVGPMDALRPVIRDPGTFDRPLSGSRPDPRLLLLGPEIGAIVERLGHVLDERELGLDA